MRQAKIEEQYFTIDQFETDYVLPEGWAAGILEELIGRGGILTDGDWIESKDQDPHGDVRLIQLADIGDGYYKDKSSRFLTSEKAKELGCTFLEKGDVLIARMPEPLGRTCIFPGDPKPAVTAVDICIIRTGDDGADHRWIMHTVNSPEIRRRIESLQKGTTRKRISRRNLASLTLPIPPFNEQRRIAVKVEELLAQVNAAKDRLARTSIILKRFRQAVLSAACSGHLTADWRNSQNDSEQVGDNQEALSDEIPKGWIRNKLTQVAKINMGQSPPGRSYNKRGEGLPFFQGKIDFGDRSPTVRVWCTEPKKMAQPGDVLISIRAPVGPTNVANQICAIGRGLAAISPKDSMTTEFILFELRLKEPELALSGTGSTFTAINQKDLEKIDINVPPLAEQHEIVRRVEAMFKLADTVEKRVETAKLRAEKLTQGILAKAFRGELVPTEAELARLEHRPYESASELLARIKAERESKESSQKVRRSRK
jgi:type I restriction enzyme S subunit